MKISELNNSLSDLSKEEYQTELIENLTILLQSLKEVTNEYGYIHENSNTSFLKEIIECIKST